MSCPVNLQDLPPRVFESVFTPENIRGSRSSMNSLTTLNFPKSRSALWDNSPAGEKLRLQLGSHRKPRLVLLEKALRLAQRHARQSNKPCPFWFFLGSVSVDADEEGVTVTLDRFDPGRDQAGSSGRVPSALLPGDVVVPCLFTSQSETTPDAVVHSEAELHHCFKALQQCVSSRQTLNLCQLIKVKGCVACSQHSDAAAFSLSWSSISPSVRVDMQPIRAVPIIPTALLRSLTSINRPPPQASRQRGFLTMDQTRKLLLLLESDPKTSTLPLVGLWLSGVTHVYNPQVWAWCLRFLFSSSIQDRVLSESGCFLFVLFGSTHRAPQFFQCQGPGAGTGLQLDYQLLTASQCVTLYQQQVVSVEGQSLQCELGSESHSRQVQVFRDAQRSFNSIIPPAGALSVSDQDSGVEDDDLSPRPSPSPHPPAQQSRRVQPSVPELSLLIDGSFISNHDPGSANRPPPPPLPPPAASAERKSAPPTENTSVPKPPPHHHSTPNSNLQQPCTCCSSHTYNCTSIFPSPGHLHAAAPPPAPAAFTHHHNAASPASALHKAPPPSSHHQISTSPPSSHHHSTPPPSSHRQTPPPTSVVHPAPPLSYHHHNTPPSSHRQTPPPVSVLHPSPPSSHHQTPPHGPALDPAPPASSHHPIPPSSPSSRLPAPSPASYYHNSSPSAPSSHHHTPPYPAKKHPSTPCSSQGAPLSSHYQTPTPFSNHSASPPSRSPCSHPSNHHHNPPSSRLSAPPPSSLLPPSSCPCGLPSCLPWCGDAPSPHQTEPMSSPWVPPPSYVNQCCDHGGGVAPSDTYKLLLHQDRQLRLLQAQVQMLLEAQGKLQTSSQPVDTQTTRSTASIAVGTGASLFWGDSVHPLPTPELQAPPTSLPSSPSSPTPSHVSSPGPSSSCRPPSHIDPSVIRSVGGAEDGDITARDAAMHSLSGLQSPVLGESASMFSPADEQQSFYHNLMNQLTSRLQESDSRQEEVKDEEEVESRRSSLTSQATVASSSSTRRKQQKGGGDRVVSATLRQLQQLGVNIDKEDLTESERRKHETVESTSTLAKISPAAVLSRLSVSEPTSSTLFPGGSVDLSLEANAIALRYLSDSQLSRLSLGGHTPWSGPASSTDSLMSPSNMSLATRKYMRRYGLIEEEEEEGEEDEDEQEVDVQEPLTRPPLGEALNVKLLPQSQLIRDLRPKLQLLASSTKTHTANKENRSTRRPSLVRASRHENEGSVGNILDLSRLRQLPKLF